jgi:hypothetical protein
MVKAFSPQLNCHHFEAWGVAAAGRQRGRSMTGGAVFRHSATQKSEASLQLGWCKLTGLGTPSTDLGGRCSELGWRKNLPERFMPPHCWNRAIRPRFSDACRLTGGVAHGREIDDEADAFGRAADGPVGRSWVVLRQRILRPRVSRRAQRWLRREWLGRGRAGVERVPRGLPAEASMRSSIQMEQASEGLCHQMTCRHWLARVGPDSDGRQRVQLTRRIQMSE